MEQTDGTGQEKSRNARLGDPKSNSGDSQSNRDEASESRQMEYVNAEPEDLGATIQESTVPFTSHEPNHSSEIFTHCKDCMDQYEDLVDVFRNVTLDNAKKYGYNRDPSLGTVQEAQARFNGWAVNIAAFQKGHLRSSLDFRLKEATDIRGRILKVLGNLQDSLREAWLIASGREPNETWHVGAISDSEDEDNTTPGEDVPETSDLEELFSAMKSANTSLMKMTMVIRNSPARDDYLKAASRYNFDPRYDIGHVKEKHGSARRSTEWLIERLGKAITRRRQYLKYREDHHGKLTRDWEEMPKHIDVKLDEKPERTIALTKATTYVENEVASKRDGSDFGGSFGSQTSYEPTIVGETAAHRLTVPPHPNMAFEGIPFQFGEPFQCPFCYTEQTVKNRAAWKKHVFRDLKPYICTFKECNLRMFRSRNEWFAHELQNHRREWACPHCQIELFTTKDEFQSHLELAHHIILHGSQLEALVLQSEEPVDRVSPIACRLCDEWETNLLDPKKEPSRSFLNDGRHMEAYGTLRQFRRHLGRHMEQLALFALPLNEGEDMDDDSLGDDEEDDSNDGKDKSIEIADHGSDSKEDNVVRAGAPREIQIDLPAVLVESLGSGAEVIASYLTTLAEAGLEDPAHHAPPCPVLCRICERQIPPWWLEKHTELCLQEHKAEMEVQVAQENLLAHRHAIVKVLDALEAREARKSRPVSGDQQPALAPPQAEYKGMPMVPAPSPSTSSGAALPGTNPGRSRERPSSGFGHARSRSFAIRRPHTRIVELLLDLCDTAIEISTPAIKETSTQAPGEFRTQSPQSESRISQVIHWRAPSTNTFDQGQGLALLCSDSEGAAKAKVEAVLRHRRVIEYAEHIRMESSVLIQDCIDGAAKIAAGR